MGFLSTIFGGLVVTGVGMALAYADIRDEAEMAEAYKADEAHRAQQLNPFSTKNFPALAHEIALSIWPEELVKLNGDQLFIAGQKIPLEDIRRVCAYKRDIAQEPFETSCKRIRRYIGESTASLVLPSNKEEAMFKVVPQIVSYDFLRELGRNDIAIHPHMPNTAVIYTCGGAYNYVTKDNLKTWGMDISELHRSAVLNVQDAFKDYEFEVTNGVAGVDQIEFTEENAAVLSLLPPEILKSTVLKGLGNNVVFSTNARNIFNAYAPRNATDIENLRKIGQVLVHGATAHGKTVKPLPYAISEDVYRLTADGIAPV